MPGSRVDWSQSLGGSGCLWEIALAWRLGLALKLPVYTADKSWKKLKAGVPVHVIR